MRTSSITQREIERKERVMKMLEASLTHRTGAPIQVDMITRDQEERTAIIATWSPADDDQITTTLTSLGWELVNHDPRIPDLGTGEGERAGAMLVPPAR